MTLVGKTDYLVWLAIQGSTLGTALDVCSVVEIESKHLLSGLTYEIEIVIFAINALAVWKVLLGRSFPSCDILGPAELTLGGVDNQIRHDSGCSEDSLVIPILNGGPLGSESSNFTIFLVCVYKLINDEYKEGALL